MRYTNSQDLPHLITSSGKSTDGPSYNNNAQQNRHFKPQIKRRSIDDPYAQ